MSGSDVSVSASESVSVSAGDSVHVGVVSDVDISSGGKLVGRVAEGVEVVSGSASLESGSSIDVVSGEDVTVSAGGDLTGYTAGAASLSASSASGEVVGDATGLIGGAGSLRVGGDVQLGSGGSGSATFGDGVSVSGGSVVVESASGLVGVGRTVEVSGSESVRVGSTGAVVELSGSGDVEYESYVWRSSSTFDEFTNAVPAMTDVTEVLVRGVGASVESAGGAVVRLSLGSGDDSSSLVTVWDSTLGAGTYSMDGLHVTFGAQSVSSVRLSVVGGGGVFVGWDAVVLHFGRSVSSGSVRVSSSSVLEAVSGESLSVSSESVSVSAGGTLDVSGGESVRVVSDCLLYTSPSPRDGLLSRMPSSA